MTALATGADKALVFQQETSEKDLERMAQNAAKKARRGFNQYTIIRNDGADDRITCDHIKNYFEQQSDTQ
ncbi:hypothetical protein GCK32_021279, partial [Trichostrongylus colubriformis]